MVKDIKNLKFYIYFIRHAETEFNKNDIIQGTTNSKLSADGIEQAKLLGKYFSDIYFDFVFTSSLERAYHTTMEIVNSNAYKSKMNVIKDNLLIERCFGEAEGKHRSYLDEIFAQQKNKTSPKGSETYEEMRCRWKEFFHSLCRTLIDFYDSEYNKNGFYVFDDNKKEIKSAENQATNMRPINVLIVSHGAFMREIFRYFIQELNVDYDFEKSLFAKSVTNASISCFLFELNSNTKTYTCKDKPELTGLEKMVNVKCLYLNKNQFDH